MSRRRLPEERQKSRTVPRAKRLRSDMSATERYFWDLLREDEGLKRRFRRQASIGPYVVDFVDHRSKVVIELDGPHHLPPEARQRDTERDRWLRDNGFRVLRFLNDEVWKETLRVLDVVRGALREQPPLPNPSPARGEGL